jgi:hypothetical protein
MTICARSSGSTWIEPSHLRLTFEDHDRDLAGLTYIYPVVSRRARGLSIGINLNPNNACNFRCVYCQVPGLIAGKAPPIDLERLRAELDGFLEWVQNGDFMQQVVPEGSRRLNDLAFSGNGEPSGVQNFEEIVECVAEIMERRHLAQKVKLILITNGTLIHQSHVQAGLRGLSKLGGEVWFKLDSATDAGLVHTNSFEGGLQRLRQNLRTASELAPVWIQSCAFARAGEPPSGAERAAMLRFLEDELASGLKLQGILLYGIARQSHQPEAEELSRLSEEWLEGWAQQLRQLSLEVRVSP